MLTLLLFFSLRDRRLSKRSILSQSTRAGYLEHELLELAATPHSQLFTTSLLILAPSVLHQQTATAVAHVTPGRGQVRLNGSPISLVEP